MLRKLQTSDFDNFQKHSIHNDKDISDDSDEEVPEAVVIQAKPE